VAPKPKPQPVYTPRPKPKPKPQIVAPKPRPKPPVAKPKAKPKPSKKRPVVGTPVATRRSKPSYPRAERRKGIEGTVVVSVRVDPNGRAGAVSVARSSGNSALDASAVKAVRRWRFKAATDSVGNPIAKVVSVPVVFKLRN
ncbi:MAG: energy transducer TonB, partial [Verrucomicrobiales bacterium]|nr:energy transducer TonB [Verrucomicrobiales bacterium]